MIAFLIILIIVAAAAELFSLRRKLSSIRLEISTSVPYSEPDEGFELITTVENLSRIPAAYIRIRENLPDGVSFDAEASSGGFRRRFSPGAPSLPPCITTSIFVPSRGRTSLRAGISLPRRGRYYLGEATVFTGDFLGFKEREEKHRLNREFIVIPSRIEEASVINALGGFIGDISVKRFIIEDPMLTAGFREYTGREPMKNIAWRQSARSGVLMVKNFDYTAEPSVRIVLSSECPSGESSAAVEYCFSLARTVCEALEKQGIQYSFVTNSTMAGVSGVFSSVALGGGAIHLETILTGLGRATYAQTESLSNLLGREAFGSSLNSAYIIIAPSLSAEHLALVRRIESGRGAKCLILTAKEGA